jgi:hypothetical protein
MLLDRETRLIEAYQKPIARSEHLESFDPRIRQKLTGFRQIIAQHEIVKNAAISSNREIGSVFATSGFGAKSPSGHQFDWGLVELNQGRMGSNSVSSNQGKI